MSMDTFRRQIARRGPVLTHYTTLATPRGYKFSRDKYGTLLTFGGGGHYIAIGWMVR